MNTVQRDLVAVNRASQAGSPSTDGASLPYWLEQSGDRSCSPDAVLPRTIDVVVVGGGILGIAIAYWLARSGVSVQLLEARDLCFGATGRNAGLFLPGASAIERPDLLHSVLEQEGIEAGFDEVGHLALTRSPQIWSRIVREADGRPAGAPVLQALGREACERLVGMKLGADILGGRWYPAGRVIDPVRYALGLAKAARRFGARIATWTPAREIRSGLTGSWVRTDRGVISAGQVVLACNAWVRLLLPELAPILHAVPAQVLATAPVAAGSAIGLALDWGTVYWRRLSDGTLIAGGFRQLDHDQDQGFTLDVNRPVQDAVTDFLTEEMLPTSRGRRPSD